MVLYLTEQSSGNEVSITIYHRFSSYLYFVYVRSYYNYIHLYVGMNKDCKDNSVGRWAYASFVLHII